MSSIDEDESPRSVDRASSIALTHGSILSRWISHRAQDAQEIPPRSAILIDQQIDSSVRVFVNGRDLPRLGHACWGKWGVGNRYSRVGLRGKTMAYVRHEIMCSGICSLVQACGGWHVARCSVITLASVG